jgi:hypothetical protein
MIITQSMMNGLLERAEAVMLRGDSYVETWISPDGITYDLCLIYEAIVRQFDPSNFVCVMLPDNLMSDIERECCDPARIRNLKGPRLLHPLLVDPEGTIIDGNHRAVKRHKLGQKFAPGYQVSSEIMDAATLTLGTMFLPDGTQRTMVL